MKLSFFALAQQEYLDATDFYEGRSHGLGAELIHDTENCLSKIVARPESGRIVHSTGIRRQGLSKFPYFIFYHVTDELIAVVSFAHFRRRPNFWIARVK
jgi:toxin ParE1/3/4